MVFTSMFHKIVWFHQSWVQFGPKLDSPSTTQIPYKQNSVIINGQCVTFYTAETMSFLVFYTVYSPQLIFLL